MEKILNPALPLSTRDELLADLRSFAFARSSSTERRIGAEAEFLPVDAESGRRVGVRSTGGAATLPVLKRLADRLDWSPEGTEEAPAFRSPSGSRLTYEPGGQIEVSAPPADSVGEVARELREVVHPMRDAFRSTGIELLEVGIDPITPVEESALEIRTSRYLRMDAHFSAIGPAGLRMMRQTASLQVNVDWASDVALHWRVLNAAAPYLTAIFANSAHYGGTRSAARSFRALTWLDVDPQRTGVLGASQDPAADYLDFALRAPAIIPANGNGHAEVKPFQATEITVPEWRAHLSTLFPEVRPRGYAEVRSIDAVAERWYEAPLALLHGLGEPRALQEAADLLGPPDPALVERAACTGIADPDLARTAATLFRIALDGALETVDELSLARAWEYYDQYTEKARAPADDPPPFPSGKALDNTFARVGNAS